MPACKCRKVDHVDCDNGYVRIADELLEALYRHPSLSGAELRVMLSLIRHTYGFHRKFCKWSISMAAADCGLPRNSVGEAWMKLRHRNMVKCELSPVGPKPGLFGPNKEPGEWLLLSGGPDSKVSGGPDSNCPVGRTVVSGGPDSNTPEKLDGDDIVRGAKDNSKDKTIDNSKNTAAACGVKTTSDQPVPSYKDFIENFRSRAIVLLTAELAITGLSGRILQKLAKVLQAPAPADIEETLYCKALWATLQAAVREIKAEWMHDPSAIRSPSDVAIAKWGSLLTLKLAELRAPPEKGDGLPANWSFDNW